jgi:glutathione S-transferase
MARVALREVGALHTTMEAEVHFIKEYQGSEDIREGPPLYRAAELDVYREDKVLSFANFVDICEYLDTLHDGPRLLGQVSTRWPQIAAINSCDVMICKLLTCANVRLVEIPALRPHDWDRPYFRLHDRDPNKKEFQRQEDLYRRRLAELPVYCANILAEVSHSLSVFEQEQVGDWGDDFGAAQIAAVCLLGYLDFRFPDENWRAEHRVLAERYELVRNRKSVLDTLPEPTATRAT